MLDPRLYILMRTDLPSMGYGKGAAQAAHAANKFIHRASKGLNMNGLLEWQNQAGDQGFGTTIVLDVGRKLKPLVHLLGGAVPDHRQCGFVTDPTYPYMVDRELFKLIPEDVHTAPPIDRGAEIMCFRNEITCAYLFCGKGDLSTLIDQFPLLRNT